MVSLDSKKSKVCMGRHVQPRACHMPRSYARLRSVQPAFQALTTVLLEAAKFNSGDEELTLVPLHFRHPRALSRKLPRRALTPSSLPTRLCLCSGVLEESGLVQRAAYLIGLVNRDRPTIRSQLLDTTFHFQQVLDVQWRVDHSVRTKYQDQIGEPTFLISIVTAGGEGVRFTSSAALSVLSCALSVAALPLVSFLRSLTATVLPC
jgi:hypothetical protein